jgi:hypothetical protein
MRPIAAIAGAPTARSPVLYVLGLPVVIAIARVDDDMLHWGQTSPQSTPILDEMIDHIQDNVRSAVSRAQSRPNVWSSRRKPAPCDGGLANVKARYDGYSAVS